MRRALLAAGLPCALLSAGLLAACVEELPTFGSARDILVDVRSVELRLPFEEFGSGAVQVTGFGSPTRLTRFPLGINFGDSVTTYALARVDSLPSEVVTQDSTGTTRLDTLFTVVGGRMVLTLDTLPVRPVSRVGLVVEGLTRSWDPQTATWTEAVDTLGRTELWAEAGAGPTLPLGAGFFDPLEEGSDSLLVPLDSAAIRFLQDPEEPGAGGVRITLNEEGRRIRLREARLIADVVPSINPDTVVELEAEAGGLTLIADPSPVLSAEYLSVGGAPAVRAVIRVDVPAFVDDDPEVCAVVTCPLELDADEILYAGLVLTGAPQEPGYLPVDTLVLDVRSVLQPDLGSRSPLGPPILAGATRVPPEIFATGREEPGTVEIPLTGYIRDLVRGETPGGGPVFNTVAILSPIEPFSFGLMRFWGPGSPFAPVLRILITEGDQVGL